MRPIHIHRAIKREPFQPFLLRTTGGQEYVIRHPECLALSPDERVVVVFDDEGAANILDLWMVESVNVNQNGKKGPRRRKR